MAAAAPPGPRARTWLVLLAGLPLLAQGLAIAGVVLGASAGWWGLAPELLACTAASLGGAASCAWVPRAELLPRARALVPPALLLGLLLVLWSLDAGTRPAELLAIPPWHRAAAAVFLPWAGLLLPLRWGAPVWFLVAVPASAYAGYCVAAWRRTRRR